MEGGSKIMKRGDTVSLIIFKFFTIKNASFDFKISVFG